MVDRDTFIAMIDITREHCFAFGRSICFHCQYRISASALFCLWKIEMHALPWSISRVSIYLLLVDQYAFIANIEYPHKYCFLVFFSLLASIMNLNQKFCFICWLATIINLNSRSFFFWFLLLACFNHQCQSTATQVDLLTVDKDAFIAIIDITHKHLQPAVNRQPGYRWVAS